MARINMYGKTRDVTKPYAIYVQGDYEIRVLKTYRNPENERKRENSQFIRWFTAAKSPATHGSFDMGDMPKDAVLEGTRLVYAELNGLRTTPETVTKQQVRRLAGETVWTNGTNRLTFPPKT